MVPNDREMTWRQRPTFSSTFETGFKYTTYLELDKGINRRSGASSSPLFTMGFWVELNCTD